MRPAVWERSKIGTVAVASSDELAEHDNDLRKVMHLRNLLKRSATDCRTRNRHSSFNLTALLNLGNFASLLTGVVADNVSVRYFILKQRSEIVFPSDCEKN